MDDLISRLRQHAAHCNSSAAPLRRALIEAAAALEAAQEDAERLDWMASEARMLPGWRDSDLWEMPTIQIDSGREHCTPSDLRKAIDSARKEASNG